MDEARLAKRREQGRAHYQRHREDILERKRQQRLADPKAFPHAPYDPDKQRAYYEANRERILEASRQYRLAHPKRGATGLHEWSAAHPERRALVKRAGRVVETAIRRGALVRPSSCEGCGRDDVPIEAAHADYTQPLVVRWLCRSCHVRWDCAEPKTRVSV